MLLLDVQNVSTLFIHNKIENICTPNGINFYGILKHNWTGPRILWTSVMIDSAGHPCRCVITKAGCTHIPERRSPKDK